jgi:hypothetical protein
VKAASSIQQEALPFLWDLACIQILLKTVSFLLLASFSSVKLSNLTTFYHFLPQKVINMPIACIFSHLFEKRVFKETLGHKKKPIVTTGLTFRVIFYI